MWTQLRPLPRGIAGACVGKVTSHLVNGARRRMHRETSCTVNHAQDLIHHHPYSVTHHHRESRKRVNVDSGCIDDTQHIIMFLRRRGRDGQRVPDEAVLP